MLLSKLKDNEKALFNGSFDRCMETCEADINFVSFFCSNLRSSDSKIAEIFDQFTINQRVHFLRHSIYLIIEFSEGRKTLDDLRLLANEYLDSAVQPYMLDLWLYNLIFAVAEFDREFDMDAKTVWLRVMSPGINALKLIVKQRKAKQSLLL